MSTAVGRRLIIQLQQLVVVLIMTTSMATTSGATPLEFEVGSALFYVVVGAGSIQTLLVITCIGILCLSMVCVCLRQKRASMYALTL